MRLVIAASVVLLASSGSAVAADCTKGLLWPYVRNPGDCLTDAEIKSGKTGVYSGPATGSVDVSTIKPPPEPAPGAEVTSPDCGGSWFWPFGSDNNCKAQNSAAPASAGAASGTGGTTPPAGNTPQAAASPQAAIPPTNRIATTSPPPQATTAAASPPPAAVVATAAPVSVPAEASPPSATVVAAPAAQPAPIMQSTAATSTTTCSKGLFWPFIRDTGDCPTAADRGNVVATTPVPANAAAAPMPTSASVVAAPAVQPPQPAPVVQPAAAMTSATCSKGLFWPFIRETGDCPTAADKGNVVPTTPVPANAAAAPMPTSASVVAAPAVQPPQPAPVVQPAAAMTSATCTKGLFWPFIRETGDCPTAADKGNVVATTPVPANAPASTSTSANVVAAPPVQPSQPAPVVQPAAAATNATCTKGLFWPFIRETGDCPTAADKGNVVATTPVPASAPAAPMPTPPSIVAAPAVQPPQPAPVVQPAAAATNASCTKGLFWPFIREAGDCPTSADKGNVVATTPVPASAPASTSTSANVVAAPAVQTSQPAPVAQPAAATTSAMCSKGLFWPFIRDAGDCPTAADQGKSSSSAPGKSAEPAVLPVSATASSPTAAPAGSDSGSPAVSKPVESGAACHKGLFWPFVREPGDCPTDADKGIKRGG